MVWRVQNRVSQSTFQENASKKIPWRKYIALNVLLHAFLSSDPFLTLGPLPHGGLIERISLGEGGKIENVRDLRARIPRWRCSFRKFWKKFRKICPEKCNKGQFWKELKLIIFSGYPLMNCAENEFLGCRFLTPQALDISRAFWALSTRYFVFSAQRVGQPTPPKAGEGGTGKPPWVSPVVSRHPRDTSRNFRGEPPEGRFFRCRRRRNRFGLFRKNLTLFKEIMSIL